MPNESFNADANTGHDFATISASVGASGLAAFGSGQLGRQKI
jgi:hypothetical protein